MSLLRITLLPSDNDKGDTSLSVPSTPSSKSVSTRSCDYEGSSDSSSQSVKTTFKDGVPLNYTLPKCFSSNVMESLESKKMMPNV